MSFYLSIKPLFLLGALTASGCTPAQRSEAISVQKRVGYHPDAHLVAPTGNALTITAPSKQATLDTKLEKISHQGISFSLVSFDSRDHSLEVADQAKGPGTSWSSAKAVAEDRNAVAAINAGFFTPEGNPLGLLIENSVKRGSYNRSSLGRGIYYLAGNEVRIERSSQHKVILRKKPTHLLQSGPMLVHKGKATVGLSKNNARPRSFIATDGNNHWCIGHADSCTLDQLGKALSTLKSPFTINSALNLDGGRSSDLWVSNKVTNGALSIRPFWNKPVRNFLILKKK